MGIYSKAGLQLDKLGIKFDKQYIDKMSGKTKKRPQLNKMLLELKKDDVVYCDRISRLGRNLKDLIEITEQLVNKGVRVVMMKEGIDTDINTYKLLLDIFRNIAEMERKTIQERVIQGVEKCKSTEIIAVEFAGLLKTTRDTLYRWIKIYESK